MSHTHEWGDKVIIVLSSHDERRLKNWCQYYRKTDKFCEKLCIKCPGSAHCESYLCAEGMGPLRKEEVQKISSAVPVVYSAHEPMPIQTIIERQKKPANQILISDRVKVLGHYATYGDRLVGKIVLVKRSGGIYKFGCVESQDYENTVVELDDGERLTFRKIASIRCNTFWVIDDFDN